jgi:hypothetical protein
MRLMLFRAGLVGALLAVTGARAQSPPTAASGYAIFGLEGAEVRAHVRIDPGNVGANQGTVKLATGARINGMVAANSIRLASGVHPGPLFCFLIRGPKRFTCATVNVPLVDSGTLGLVQVLAGSTTVSVPPHARAAPLPAGGYGTVKVGAHGVLTLAGGTYAVRSVTLKKGSSLLCAADCRIQVEDRVKIATGALVGSGVSDGGAAVSIEVQAGGARPVVRADSRSTIEGTVYAPAGVVRLGSHGTFDGTFIGRTVTVGSRAHVQGPATE